MPGTGNDASCVVDRTLPRLSIRGRVGVPACARVDTCRELEQVMWTRHVDRYIARGQPFAEQIVAAHLDLRGLAFPAYETTVRRLHKGNSVREAKRAARLGYICEPFPFGLFVPDVVEINHSKPLRCGRVMTEEYRRSVEELGGTPQDDIPLQRPDCPRHFDFWWGAFRDVPGHRQGAVRTDRQLVAYIRLRRIGNYMLYGQILGHGDFLRDGIMYHLHFTVVQWLTERRDELTLDLDYLVYAGMYQGQAGLQQWKKKLAFAPGYMVLAEDEHAGNGSA